MILNLTQHAATPDQLVDGVVDLPGDAQDRLRRLLTFDTLPDRNEVRKRAEEIAELADAHMPPRPFARRAMIGGAPYLMSALEHELTFREIIPVYSFTRRETVEGILPDGTVWKKSIFKHCGFVEALR